MATGQPDAHPKPLAAKKKRFVEEYVKDWNGAAAAERAGYAPASARQQAYHLLREPAVLDYLQKFMEPLTMSSTEALLRMTEWGRGTMAPFLSVTEDGGMSINLSTEAAKRHYHLIRKVTQTRTLIRMEDVEREEIRTTVELHDAKDAVKQIQAIRGQVVQRIDQTTNGKDLPAPGSNIYVPDNGRE